MCPSPSLLGHLVTLAQRKKGSHTPYHAILLLHNGGIISLLPKSFQRGLKTHLKLQPIACLFGLRSLKAALNNTLFYCGTCKNVFFCILFLSTCGPVALSRKHTAPTTLFMILPLRYNNVLVALCQL